MSEVHDNILVETWEEFGVYTFLAVFSLKAMITMTSISVEGQVSKGEISSRIG